MDLTITALLIITLFVILGSGVWIGLSLAGVAWIGMELFTSRPVGDSMAVTIWGSASSWTLTALPLFIWMGEILFRTKLSEDMFKGLAPWLEKLPGRLLHTNIIGCTIFAAVSGSSAATCACLEPVLTAPIWLTAVSIEVLPSSAALAVWVDSVAISPAVAATSCIVAEISSTIAEVSLTAPTCFSLPIATCWIDWATLLAASADCWALAVSCSDEAATCSADWEICFSRPRMLWVRLLIAADSLPTSSLRRSSSGGTLAVKLPAAN